MEAVWEVFSDFRSYPGWNPLVTSIKGNMVEEGHLSVSVRLAGRKTTYHLRPYLIRVEKQRTLRWRGNVFLPGFLASNHTFLFGPISENRTRFVQMETLTGLLVPLAWPKVEEDLREGIRLMNQEFKERVESSCCVINRRPRTETPTEKRSTPPHGLRLKPE